MIAILVMYALFGLTFIIARDVALTVPAIFFIGIRMVLAGLLLGSYIFIKHRKEIRFKREEFPWFLGIIFFHIYLAYILEFISLQSISGSRVALFYNLSPFITGLLAYFIFSEKITKQRILGLCLGFAAFIPSFSGDDFGLHLPAVSEFLLLISITSSCVGWIIMKKLTQTFNHSFLFVNTVAMFVGGVLALCTSAFFETWPSINVLILNRSFLFDLCALIVIANIICYNLYGYLLSRYSPTFISFCGCVTPLFAAFFGHVLLHEEISQSFFMVVSIAALGLYIFHREDMRLGYINK